MQLNDNQWSNCCILLTALLPGIIGKYHPIKRIEKIIRKIYSDILTIKLKTFDIFMILRVPAYRKMNNRQRRWLYANFYNSSYHTVEYEQCNSEGEIYQFLLRKKVLSATPSLSSSGLCSLDRVTLHWKNLNLLQYLYEKYALKKE